MSYLLEVLGRGWAGRLSRVFKDRLNRNPADPRELLEKRERESDSAELQLGLGFAWLHAGEAAKARDAFLESARLDGENPLARIGAACCCEQLGLIDEAGEQLSAAADLDPDDAAVQFGLGYCHERQGRRGEAITHYRGALRVCPTMRPARERLAAIFLRQNALAAAIDQYEHLLVEEPGDTDL
ncbi:MAG TPA: tetratricopeptide repeat protein, partial [Phycisphaerae bacterium]|nr:tetratricopeptide repeat protein [Phycisphaerae bacterium]